MGDSAPHLREGPTARVEHAQGQVLSSRSFVIKAPAAATANLANLGTSVSSGT